jgi:tetratricopeptide (TPR) repeat protein
MRNTVAQTPNIRKLRNIYIRALVDDGDIDEALKQYKLAAVALPSLLGDEQAALNIGNKLIAAGRNQEAQLLYQDAVERTQGKSEPLLKATLKQLCAMQAATSSPRDQQRYADLIVKYSVKLPGKSQPGLGTTTSSTR